MKKSKAAAGGNRSRFLALIPLSVAALLGALILPRSAPPRDIPLPDVDTRAVARLRAGDHARAERARTKPLNGNARELGSALRDFNTKEARSEDAKSLMTVRDTISAVLPRALGDGVEDLLALRAVQMEGFLEEVRKFEDTGKETDELSALGGPFVNRMKEADWCTDHQVLLTDDERRVAFKLTWNGLAGLDRHKDFAPAVDEWRVLYTLYLRLPHLAEASRQALLAARRGAKDPSACAALDVGERLSVEAWRYEKIKKFGAIDPSYPLAYALGVSHYLRGQYPASVESFRDWQREHPRGPFALRTNNHLKAALEAAAF